MSKPLTNMDKYNLALRDRAIDQLLTVLTSGVGASIKVSMRIELPHENKRFGIHDFTDDKEETKAPAPKAEPTPQPEAAMTHAEFVAQVADTLPEETPFTLDPSPTPAPPAPPMAPKGERRQPNKNLTSKLVLKILHMRDTGFTVQATMDALGVSYSQATDVRAGRSFKKVTAIYDSGKANGDKK